MLLSFIFWLFFQFNKVFRFWSLFFFFFYFIQRWFTFFFFFHSIIWPFHLFYCVTYSIFPILLLSSWLYIPAPLLFVTPCFMFPTSQFFPSHSKFRCSGKMFPIWPFFSYYFRQRQEGFWFCCPFVTVSARLDGNHSQYQHEN